MEESPLRKCGKCLESNPVSEFSPRKGGGWQGYCRTCHQVYKREHYQKNREKYVASTLRGKARLKAILLEAKDRACADCGQHYPPYVLDFDRLEGEEKLFNVSALNHHRWVSPTMLRAEIGKCDLVCANCHRERTHQRYCRKAAMTSG